MGNSWVLLAAFIATAALYGFIVRAVDQEVRDR